MFTVLRCIHFLGLTMFLGSIWVYIALGTPEEPAALTSFVRGSIATLTRTLTIPGLALVIVSGLGMLASRRGLLKIAFGKVKLALGTFIAINTYFIYQAIQEAVRLTSGPGPFDMTAVHRALGRESMLGALNVLCALFLIGYSVRTLRRAPRSEPSAATARTAATRG